MNQEKLLQAVNNELSFIDERKTGLLAIQEEYSDLKIENIDDADNYNKVVEALKVLQKERTSLNRDAKGMRDVFTKLNRTIREKEKEQLEIIVPLENKLKDNKQDIDQQILLEKRKVLLPTRLEQLKQFDSQITEQEILMLGEEEWVQYINTLAEEKAEKIRIENERKIREDEIRKQAIEKEKERMEQEKKQAVEQERKKAEQEKREAEQERIRLEQQLKKKEEETAKAIDAVTEAKVREKETIKEEVESIIQLIIKEINAIDETISQRDIKQQAIAIVKKYL